MDDLTALVIHAMRKALAVDGKELVSWHVREKEATHEQK